MTHHIHVRAVVALSVLALAGTLGACGTDDDTSAQSSGQNAAVTAADAAGGPQTSAQADAEVKSMLRSIATAYETYFTQAQAYPDGRQTDSGFAIDASSVTPVPAGVTVSAKRTTSGTYGAYCLSATSTSGTAFYYNSAGGGLTTTACA